MDIGRAIVTAVCIFCIMQLLRDWIYRSWTKINATERRPSALKARIERIEKTLQDVIGPEL